MILSINLVMNLFVLHYCEQPAYYTHITAEEITFEMYLSYLEYKLQI